MRKFSLFICVLLITLAGCSALPKLPFQAAGQLTPCPGLKVGILIGEDNDPLAKEQRDGYELALERVNADGGPSGCKLSLVYQPETSGGTPNQVYRAVRNLVDEENVIAILGGTSSESSMLAASLTNHFAIPMLIPSTSNTHVLPDSNHWTFQIEADDERYSQAAFDLIKKQAGPNPQIAIVFENTTAGHDAAVIAAGEAALQEMTLSDYLAVDTSQSNAAEVFNTLRESQPDALYLIFNKPSQASTLLNAYKDHGATIPFTIAQGNGFTSRSFLYGSEGKLNPLASNLVLVTPWIGQAETDEGKQFVKDFAEYTGRKDKQSFQPTAISVQAYKALRLLDAAIRSGSSAWNATTLQDLSAAREALRADLQAYHEKSPTWGTTTFSNTGENQADVHLAMVKKDALKEIDSSAVPTRTPAPSPTFTQMPTIQPQPTGTSTPSH